MDFWDLGPDEIISVIESRNRVLKDLWHFEAVLAWNQAGWILDAFSKNPQPKELSQYFPALFDEIKEDPAQIEKQLQMNIEAFRAFAERHNKENK